MTDAYAAVCELLEGLQMRDALGALDSLCPDDDQQRFVVLSHLERLLQFESDRRLERRIERRIRDARLPNSPTLEVFDFDFQPTLDKGLVLDLARLAWVDRAEDLLLIGQSGVGKSHIAKALALMACSQARRVLYTTCADMLFDLTASLADNSLRERLKRYQRPDLLVIDDLGYDPIEQQEAREAQLLYKVLEGRHQKRSTIVTSNLPIEMWADYLGDHYLTVALLDRLLFHATTITIEGPSYRLAHHAKRQKDQQPGEADKDA